MSRYNFPILYKQIKFQLLPQAHILDHSTTPTNQSLHKPSFQPAPKRKDLLCLHELLVPAAAGCDRI